MKKKELIIAVILTLVVAGLLVLLYQSMVSYLQLKTIPASTEKIRLNFVIKFEIVFCLLFSLLLLVLAVRDSNRFDDEDKPDDSRKYSKD